MKARADVILLHCLSPSVGRYSGEGLTQKNGEKIQHNTTVVTRGFNCLLNVACCLSQVEDKHAPFNFKLSVCSHSLGWNILLLGNTEKHGSNYRFMGVTGLGKIWLGKRQIDVSSNWSQIMQKYI